MDAFEYNANAGRVVFGAGSLSKLPAELARLSLHNPLLLSTPEQRGQVESLQASLSSARVPVAGIYSKATMHTPTHITDDAMAKLKELNADCIVSLGGGSTIGLGKALSLRTGLPHICIPTTYAGSEMTPILGETADGKKVTKTDPKILPGTVIYDVDLTMTLPVGMSATSGVNAIAHAIEALYAQNANPVISLLALEGVSALASALPAIVANSSDKGAREKAQYGAWLCGTCLGSVGMALHHKLCHTLGGSFNLPHAETHTIVLPHAVAYNAPSLPASTLTRLAAALDSEGGETDPVRALNALLKKLGVKRALREFGMKEEDVASAADMAVRNPYYNPRSVEVEPIRELIRRAWAGEDAKDL